MNFPLQVMKLELVIYRAWTDDFTGRQAVLFDDVTLIIHTEGATYNVMLNSIPVRGVAPDPDQMSLPTVGEDAKNSLTEFLAGDTLDLAPAPCHDSEEQS